MKFYKHNTKEVYINSTFSEFGSVYVESVKDNTLVQKEFSGTDLSSFHEIQEQEYRRWRIHEVIYDGDIKLPQATFKPS